MAYFYTSFDDCILLMTDGAYYSEYTPRYLVSVAVCECRYSSLPLHGNWYYKFKVDDACDEGFYKGSSLAEICATHAAMSLIHHHRLGICADASIIIVFDCLAVFGHIRTHSTMEMGSGRWEDVEVHRVVYHICELILGVLDAGRTITLRHKRTFCSWDNNTKTKYPPHVELLEALQDPRVSDNLPHVLPVETNLRLSPL